MDKEQRRRENVGIAAAVLVIFSCIISIAFAAIIIVGIDRLLGLNFYKLLDNGIFRIIIAAIAAFFLAPIYFDRTQD